MKVLIVFASVFGLSLAQFPNGRILEPPVPALCAQRVIHERSPDGKGYWFSWRDQNTQGLKSLKTFEGKHVETVKFCDNSGKEEDWLAARNFCRQRCMDSVSVETSPENEWIKQRLTDGKGENVKKFNGRSKFLKFFGGKNVRDKNLNRIKIGFAFLPTRIMYLCHIIQDMSLNIYLQIGNFFLLVLFCTFRPQICFYGRA